MVKIHGTLIVDTGFWLAFFDKRDSNHSNASKKSDCLERLNILFPWPVLYETLRTRFIKDATRVQNFEKLLKRPNIKFIDDEYYRKNALDSTFKNSLIEKRPISMIDMLLRLMIEDINLNIRYILTFNLRDFNDICRKRQIEIL